MVIIYVYRRQKSSTAILAKNERLRTQNLATHHITHGNRLLFQHHNNRHNAERKMSDQNSETILKDPCAELLRLANICVQIDPQACVTCFDPVTFQTALLQETTREFQKAMGFAVPSDPTFCDVAKQKVCDNYIATQSCCCQEETAAYRQCLFNEVLVPSVGLSSAQCSDTCSQKEGGEGSSSGGSTEAIIGIIVALVILVGIFCSVYIYRRRNRVGDLPTTRTSDKKKSFLASFGSNTPKRRASEKKVEKKHRLPRAAAQTIRRPAVLILLRPVAVQTILPPAVLTT
jgi:hypothetical protein